MLSCHPQGVSRAAETTIVAVKPNPGNQSFGGSLLRSIKMEQDRVALHGIFGKSGKVGIAGLRYQAWYFFNAPGGSEHGDVQICNRAIAPSVRNSFMKRPNIPSLNIKYFLAVCDACSPFYNE